VQETLGLELVPTNQVVEAVKALGRIEEVNIGGRARRAEPAQFFGPAL
jgi:hypothetical protein